MAAGNLIPTVPRRDDNDHVRVGVREIVHLPVQGSVRRSHRPPAVGADPSAEIVRRLQHLGLTYAGEHGKRKNEMIRVVDVSIQEMDGFTIWGGG